jgi:2-pyrone-4,6-dicarboxylate lactonase
MTRPCPGPLPPMRPRQVPPQGTCDTHVHVIGPYARYPLVEDRAYTAPEAPVSMLRAHLNALGVTRVVVVHVTVCGLDLSVTLDAIRELGDCARGIAIVDPGIKDGELERLNACGIRGVRFSHLSEERHGFESLTLLARRITPFGWHVQFSPIDLAHWLEVGPHLPELPTDVVVDHMAWRAWNTAEGLGQPGFRLLIELVASGRVWVKVAAPQRYSNTGGPPFADVNPYAHSLIKARPDRMLWGTDWPHVTAWNHPMPRDADLLDWVLEWPIDDAIKHAMLVGNPAHLYGF